MTWPELIKYLPPLTQAVMNGDAAQVRALLEGGAAVDEIDHAHPDERYAEYALTIVDARPPDPAQLKILQDMEGRPVGHYPQHITPLMVAALHGHEACVAVLLEHGANPNRLDNIGRSAVGLAIINNHRGCMEQLVRAGGSLDAPRHDLLAEGVKKGYVDVVEGLLKLGRDPTPRTHGETYTMMAMRYGRSELADRLGDRLGPVTCPGCGSPEIELGPFGMIMSWKSASEPQRLTQWKCSGCRETFPNRTPKEGEYVWHYWGT